MDSDAVRTRSICPAREDLFGSFLETLKILIGGKKAEPGKLTELIMDFTASDITACYIHNTGQKKARLEARRGIYDLPAELDMESPGLDMVSTDNKIVIAGRDEKEKLLDDILLEQSQKSGVAVIIQRSSRQNWVLILNSIIPEWYDGSLVKYCEGLKEILEIYTN